VIVQINRQRIERASDVQEVFRRLAGRTAIRVYVERGGSIGWTEFYVQ